MTNGYPIFEWSPGIPFKDKEDKIKNEDDEIAWPHEDKNYDDITENGEEQERIKEEIYEDN